MQTRLFPPQQRTNTNYARKGEPAYAYLQSSGRIEAELVRQQFEKLFNLIPESNKKSILNRFRSLDERSHYGASLELESAGILHWLDAHISCPTLQSKKTPDFKATWQDGSVYVECTTVTEISDAEANGSHIKNNIETSLNSIEHEDFVVAVRDFSGFPATPQPVQDMIYELSSWLDTLSWVDAVGRIDHVGKHDPGSVRSSLRYRDLLNDNYSFRAYAVPKDRTARGTRNQTPYAGFDPPTPFEAVKSHVRMRDDLKSKSNKYVNVDCPLVLVSSTHRWRLHDEDMLVALFGTNNIRINVGPSEFGKYEGQFRSPDGLWTTASRHLTHVAGVLLIDRTEPWDCGWAMVTLFTNPWSKHKLPSQFDRVRQYKIRNDGEYAVKEGPSLADILGLWRGWPEQPEKLRSLGL